MDTQLLEVVKKALWNQNDVVTADQAVFLEMKAHHIEALAAPVLYELGLAQDILDEWEKNIVKHIGMYMRYKQIQSCLPVSVPYVILKGTAAAQYYPYPEYRTFGDIDIMTSHENHQRACEQLRNHGFLENTNAIEQEVERHRTFIKKGIVVEVHSFYALRDDPKETEIMDDLIIQNINPAHILPDLINGLTLIEHINHHMEEGIGLRQILDWMMFVDKCLPDEKWPEFEKIAALTGHVQLSIVTTRMCELYLGLSEHAWCSHADPEMCESFMEYVLACGNFGRKRNYDSLISERLLSSPSLRKTYKILKHQALLNRQEHTNLAVFKPVSWCFQLTKIIFRGLTRDNALYKLKEEYKNSKRRKVLFNSIGIAREKKGRVIYRNGKYINNRH